MSRATAPERFERVLAMVPWIVANPGVALAEVAERFEISQAQLLKELDVLWMVGLPPYSPDALIDVQIEDDRVWLHYADFFARPLRLTPVEALALVATSDALAAIPGSSDDGALVRALEKLRKALGLVDGDAVDVNLGDAGDQVLETVRSALADPRDIHLDYLSLGRGTRSERTVSPWRLYADSGAWYLLGWCQSAQGRRVFRVDRIVSAEITGPRTVEPPATLDVVALDVDPDTPTVRLRLAPESRWVLERYPHHSVVEQDDGGALATFPVTAKSWLQRLLLQLGHSVTVVEADSRLGDGENLASEAALAVLARYNSVPLQ